MICQNVDIYCIEKKKKKKLVFSVFCLHTTKLKNFQAKNVCVIVHFELNIFNIDYLQHAHFSLI